MAIWILDEYDDELDYPALGFRALPGDLLDASAAPDARWSLNGDQGAAETVERYVVGSDPSYVEPGNGHVLTWSDEENAYVPTTPGTVVAEALGEALPEALDEVLPEKVSNPDDPVGAALFAGYVPKPGGSIADYAVAARLTSAGGFSWVAKEEHVARALGWVIATDPQWEGGARPDEPDYDSMPAFNAAFESIEGVGGKVWAPGGVYGASRPVIATSRCGLQGPGRSVAVLRAMDDAVFADGEFVFMSKDFLPGRNVWGYYKDVDGNYPTGLHVDVGINGFTIDANREHVANAGAVGIYGTWTLGKIGVANTAGHGIWTECGLPTSSTSGDDWHDFLNMHESYAHDVKIVNPGKHGWLYRGPNDSTIDVVQIKTPGWAAFYQDYDGTTFAAGGLKIGSLHAYAAACGHDADGEMIRLTDAHVTKLYVDSSFRNGARFVQSSSVVDQIYALDTNKNNAGDFWSVLVESSGTMIGLIKDTTNAVRSTVGGEHGGSVWVKSSAVEGTSIGQIRASTPTASTVDSTGVKVEGDGTVIGSLNARGFGGSAPGSVGLDLNASSCSIRARLRACATAFHYRNAGKGRNFLELNYDNNTTDETIDAAIGATDIIFRRSTTGALNKVNIGDVALTHPADGVLGLSGAIQLPARSQGGLPVGSLFTHSLDGRPKYVDDTDGDGVGTARTLSIVEYSRDASEVSSGESTLRRTEVTTSSLATTSGTLRLTYFTCKKAEATQGARVCSGATAAAATPTLIRLGLYLVDASTGDLTLVASTANDTSLFAAASTQYTKAWSAGYTKVLGQRYAFGTLVVGAGTMPTFLGTLSNAALNLEYAATPRLGALVTGQTDLPASIAAGSLTTPTGLQYAVATP